MQDKVAVVARTGILHLSIQVHVRPVIAAERVAWHASPDGLQYGITVIVVFGWLKESILRPIDTLHLTVSARVDRDGQMGVTSTAITEVDPSTVALYPNPAAESITVASRQGEQLEEVRIFSSSGAMVASIHHINSDVLRIDVRDLAPGSYHLRVLGAMGEGTARFIKE